MTRPVVALLLLTILISIFCLIDSDHNGFTQTAAAAGKSFDLQREHDGHLVKGMAVFGDGSGLCFTSSEILRTADGGKSWEALPLPLGRNETISTVNFRNGLAGLAIVGNVADRYLSVLKTEDGGAVWLRSKVSLREIDLAEARLDSVRVDAADSSLRLTLTISSSSNFAHTSVYVSGDSGSTWKHLESDNRIVSESPERRLQRTFSIDKVALGMRANEDVVQEVRAERMKWILSSEGVCENFKTNCYQTNRIYDVSNGYLNEITPVRIAELTMLARDEARFAATMSALMPPGGSTRISLNRGFDKCTAATAAQMKTWWDTSPYYDANIYMSGRNRGCTQPQLTASWVSAVSSQGWGLIPTIVGYQSPCSSCTSCQKHSSDSALAEQQGRDEADIAITDATNLGLTQGTALYYDMEIYDTANTGTCSASTKAFLKGWTDRVKERGYISGVYGSPTNAMRDWVNIPSGSQPQAVWWARWDNIMSVWTFTGLPVVVPENVWDNHQRIKQWKAPHNDTWGGVTFNIDGNIADAPVAGVQQRNRRADFDGDGKSDIAVWRPENGAWYVLNSSDGSFKAVAFGAPTDILTPGDFDGDGRTDISVWRPSDGIWHIYSRSIYTAYQFGANGDIPVPADYDGDGRTDIAVYRPSNGMWYIRNSFDSKGTSFRFEQFGVSEDTPVPGDFDADGKADLAVFRPSNGVWYMMRSSAGFTAVQFGMSTDKPVSADYDGDGKSDPAVYRDGIWHILGSQAGYYGFGFGLADDKPTPGDFDGDGKADVAVFRTGSGIWYVLGSSQGFFAAQFGFGTDKPIPSAYTPKN